jgi:DNA-binding NarL/FixJ family response regulator
MKNIALLIVDDHPVYRDALGEKLRVEFSNQLFPVLMAADAREGIVIVESGNDSDWVVLLDVQLPGLSGEDAISQFKQQPRVAHVIAISGLDEQVWRELAIRSGVTTFISKSNPSQFICDQIKALLRLPATRQSSMLTAAKEFRFTARQKDVLKYMAKGHPNKIIAEALSISEQTVKIYVGQIFRELKVTNRTQAVLKAHQNFLID